jgi:hypothetical protein
LKPQHALSLEIVYELYSLVFDRIDVKNGTFTTEELTPTPEEAQAAVDRLISKF